MADTDACDESGMQQVPARCANADGEPGIVITVPGVEDLHSVAELLQRTSAKITAGRRRIKVKSDLPKGDLTLAQTALMELATFRDWKSNGYQPDITFVLVRYGRELDRWAEHHRRAGDQL
jgi:hypothetical protein